MWCDHTTPHDITFLAVTPHYSLQCSMVWLCCRWGVPGLWTKVGWWCSTVCVLVAVDDVGGAEVVRVTNDVEYSRHGVWQQQTELQLPVGGLLSTRSPHSSVPTIRTSHHQPASSASQEVYYSPCGCNSTIVITRGLVVQWLGRRTCDWKIAGSLSGNNLGQVVHTRVPLLPSSIIWYRSTGGDALRLGR